MKELSTDVVPLVTSPLWAAVCSGQSCIACASPACTQPGFGRPAILSLERMSSIQHAVRAVAGSRRRTPLSCSSPWHMPGMPAGLHTGPNQQGLLRLGLPLNDRAGANEQAEEASGRLLVFGRKVIAAAAIRQPAEPAAQAAWDDVSLFLSLPCPALLPWPAWRLSQKPSGWPSTPECPSSIHVCGWSAGCPNCAGLPEACVGEYPWMLHVGEQALLVSNVRGPTRLFHQQPSERICIPGQEPARQAASGARLMTQSHACRTYAAPWWWLRWTPWQALQTPKRSARRCVPYFPTWPS